MDAIVAQIATAVDALAWLGLVGYGTYMFMSLLGYRKLLRSYGKRRQRNLPPLTIIIPARNEQHNLPACLDAILTQQYPQFSVIVVDDASTDGTLQLARTRATQDTRIQVLRAHSGKKAALAAGIAAAQTEWVITLDADCTPPPRWLATMASHMDADAAMVCGPVRLQGPGLLAQWQALESAGLMVLSAGAVGLEQPGMNNGANLALRKSAFEAVSGYGGIDHLASGDDMLLMQKLASAGRGIRYAAQVAAVVPTAACTTLPQLLVQRRRWLSKTRAYRNFWLLFGSGSMFLLCLGIVVLAAMLPFAPVYLPTLAILLAIKLLIELPILVAGCWLVRRPALLLWWLPVQLVQMPYVLWSALQSQRRGSYVWKDRRVQ